MNSEQTDIAALQSRIKQLEQQCSDLEIGLSTAIEHGDLVQAELEQANQRLQGEIRERMALENKLRVLVNSITQKSRDLEVILQAITEHSDQLDLQWLNRYVETENAANTDALTGLANRRVFDQSIVQEWARARRNQQPLALIVCDIDFFKKYNDNYGHQQGDYCLRQVALALKGAVQRVEDLVARYGGEEFIVLLPNTDLAGALEIAQHIAKRLHEANIPHEYSAISDRITISMGVCAMIPSDSDNSRLFATADHLLYQAKNDGRNRIAS